MAKYKKLHIKLSHEQRKTLERIVSMGICGAMEIRRANVLILADEAAERKRQKDVEIAKTLHITPQAVHNIKLKFLERKDADPEDSNGGIARKKRTTPPVPAKCTSDVEAKIIAVACSSPPQGKSRWNLRLIAEKVMELQILDSISHSQVGRILKKHNISLT